MEAHERAKAIITGAACGLGRSLALALAAEGWDVGIADIDADGAGTVLDQVRRTGGDGDVFRCDVADCEQVQAMVDHFFTRWGRLDLLVNNAGVATVGDVGTLPVEEWRRLIHIDLFGVIHGCHAAIPRMKRQGHGHILNTASAGGVASLPGMSAYNVCKAGVISLSETLKVELAPFHIGVSVICPTFFQSNLIGSFPDGDHPFLETTRTGFRRTAVTSERVAQEVLHALKRRTFYIFPQANARHVWRAKRLAPSLYLRTLARLNRTGRLEPLLRVLARRGQL